MSKHRIVVDYDDRSGDLQVGGIPKEAPIAAFMISSLDALFQKRLQEMFGPPSPGRQIFVPDMGIQKPT